MEAIAPSKSLVEKTYDALLDAICTGVFRPGDRLTQDDVAERLNVSRQPVNSAIAMLKAQRFVEDTGRRGVVVAPVDLGLFTSIYQVRSALEPLAVELATPRLSGAHRSEGHAILRRGMALVEAGDRSGVLQADIDFHSLIARISGNPILEDIMRLNWQHIRRSMGRVLSFPGLSVQVWKEHERIFEAMAGGNAAAAAQLMREHIMEAPKRVGRAEAPQASRNPS